eukprot:m.268706 g.268706  ORF g.268706 m.268706 type:complete len:53 (-) comp26815_c0_seq1:943-1101(-)
MTRHEMASRGSGGGGGGGSPWSSADGLEVAIWVRLDQLEVIFQDLDLGVLLL